MKISPASYGFPAGTMVHTDQGLVPIQDIKVGDLVLSRPESGGEHAPTEYKRVLRVFCSGTGYIYRLVYVENGYAESWHSGNLCAEKIKVDLSFVSENYPFWVEEKNEWVLACELRDGESVLSTIDPHKKVTVLSCYPVLANKSEPSQYGYCSSNPSSSVCEMVIKSDQNRLKVNVDSDCYYEYKLDGFLSLNQIELNLAHQLFGTDKKFSTQAFNIEVEDFHSYFIGNQSIWVLAAKP